MALFLSNLGAAGIILTIAVMLASGFLLTRFTKRLHLPNVTGYIIAGVIIGPWCMNLVPSQYIEQMDFITDLALAFIAFGVGKYFKLSSLKANGKKMVILTLFESLTAGIFITIVMLIMGLSLSFSLLLGAIGGCSPRGSGTSVPVASGSCPGWRGRRRSRRGSFSPCAPLRWPTGTRYGIPSGATNSKGGRATTRPTAA